MEYSLLHRDPETDGVLDACRRHDISLVPYYPLASGLLTGKHELGKETGRLALERYDRFKTDANYAVVHQLREFAQEYGHSMGSLAIAWFLQQPAVPAVIVRASSPGQVTANAAATQLTLNKQEVLAIEQMTRPSRCCAPS